MAGGGDPITARFLYQREFEFIPEFKLFIATNHRPRIRDDSEAIWDRLYMLPFGVRFEEEEVDTSLPEKLAGELPGILNLAVAGCLDWQREGGLRPPDKVLAAKTEYRTQEDTFKQWLEERCIEEDHMQTRGGVLWKDYAAWSEDAKITPMSSRRFGERLTERFHKTASAYVVYDGVGLRTEEPG